MQHIIPGWSLEKELLEQGEVYRHERIRCCWGKVIITGGCNGLGRAIAKAPRDAGTQTLNMDVSTQIEEICRQDGHPFAVQVNLSVREALTAKFQEAMTLLGNHVDILVNCASVQ